MNYKVILLFLLITIISVGVVSADENVESVEISEVIDDGQDLMVVTDEVDTKPVNDTGDVDVSTPVENSDDIIVENNISNIVSNSTGNDTNQTNHTNVTPVHPVKPIHPPKQIPTKHIAFNQNKIGSIISHQNDDSNKNLTNNTTRQNGTSPSENRFEKNTRNVLKEIDVSLPVILFIVILLIGLVVYRNKN